MARVTVEDCLEEVPNRFVLVQLVSKRAKQLLKGAKPTRFAKQSNKYIVNSLREVAGGSVYFQEKDLKKVDPELWGLDETPRTPTN